MPDKKPTTKNGGKRPGAGRKPGKPTKKTLEKKKINEAVNQKIMRFADRLVEAQMTISLGCTYLFKKPKIGKSRPVIVTDPKEIEKYLMGEFEDSKNADYYFMTTERPDNKAIDSALNRALGKPVETHKLEDEDGKALGVVFLPVKNITKK